MENGHHYLLKGCRKQNMENVWDKADRMEWSINCYERLSNELARKWFHTVKQNIKQTLWQWSGEQEKL